ncbi:Vacuolar protein sorting-associated protein 52-like protein [Aphelenchoides besseyi]|nr:Vacuolar protein sorting-associated protein 52-like protein [Aphelenchoides besseyi]KAI6210673.1 Vacuolar protein sorting-associated protein 52-like protein [Aphelenchoides besseyi]
MASNSDSDSEDFELDVENEFVRKQLQSGVDLRDYAANVESQLRETNQFVVSDCVKRAEELSELHDQLKECDNVFGSLESMLTSFLDELGTISVDMKRLQNESVEINQQLHNRQKVSCELSQFVADMIVPANMIRTITEKDVNDCEFLEQLHELQHKLQFLKAQEFKDAKAAADVHDVVENLKFKAMEKIREWLLIKISLFKKPLTNYQIPQNALLKNRFFYEFLLANDRALAREIKDEYTDTLSKMFFSYFKTYVSRLFKLQMADSATKEDLLGAEDVAKIGYANIPNISNIFSSKPHTRSRATVFSLGGRESLVSTDFLTPLIVPSSAQQAGEQFQFESIFRSIQYALADHCSHEFLFLCDFFIVDGQSAVDLFTQVMGKAMSLLLKNMEERIAINYDAISLFLCICLCTKYSELMAERCVVSIDGYWQSLAKLLWSRFEFVMNGHNDSVRQFGTKQQVTVDTRPHYVIRRYAELTCALLVITSLSGKKMDDRLQSLLSKQQTEIEGLLNRLGGQLKKKKERLVFQINNYDIILTVLDEKVPDESRERAAFWELQQTKIQTYVEEVLAPHFCALIQFVNECEPLVEQNNAQQLAKYTGKVTAIIRAFATDWKRSIEAVNGEVLKSFTNFKNGTNILQMAFTQFINYYQRFTKILNHDAFRSNPHATNELVGAQQIISELKKYKPVY